MLRREEIYERVWGYAMAHGDRSVDVFVRKLRQKLRAISPSWSYIHTHFGVGYRFAPELEGDEIEVSRRALEAGPRAGRTEPLTLIRGCRRRRRGRTLRQAGARPARRSQVVHIVVTIR